MSDHLKNARIVVADDDTENAQIIEASLKQDGHQCRLVHDGEAAFHLVRSWLPHLVLLDVSMPKMTGIECLKKIRALSGGEYIGVVLVTANSSLDEIIVGLDTGADDYIVKPYRVDELRARARNCLRIKSIHDSLRRANKRLEEVAMRDDLTGFYNMRYMMKALTEQVEIAKKQRMHLSCVMFDMDHFKQVNDRHDHLFGSYVLREVAQVIQPVIRSTDIPARYGGDEYFVAMPGTSLKEAVEVSERLRKAIQEHTFRSGSYSVRVTGSFGVAGTQDLATDLSTLEPRELVRAADSALYSAKNGGRNRVETYDVVRVDPK